MNSRQEYAPGAAFGAEVHKDAEKWTLVLVRDLRHAPARVWEALTDPAQLREWAPYDSDRSLAAVLDRFVAGQPIGRMAGPVTMQHGGWQRLTAEYAKQFGVGSEGS